MIQVQSNDEDISFTVSNNHTSDVSGDVSSIVSDLQNELVARNEEIKSLNAELAAKNLEIKDLKAVISGFTARLNEFSKYKTVQEVIVSHSLLG